MSINPEHDPEIAAMDAVRIALDALGPLPDTGATERILRWACDRYGVSLEESS